MQEINFFDPFKTMSPKFVVNKQQIGDGNLNEISLSAIYDKQEQQIYFRKER